MSVRRRAVCRDDVTSMELTHSTVPIVNAPTATFHMLCNAGVLIRPYSLRTSALLRLPSKSFWNTNYPIGSRT